MDLLEMVQMENLDEEQKVLAELIGLEAFKSLVRAFNGTSIYIPKIESLEKTVRDELIKEEFDGSNYKELALKYGDGIRVNAIAPGFFIGDQNRAVLINPDGSLTDRSKKVLAKTPMKRFGDINELNGAVQFLCSDAASFVTGALLPIDGGFSAFSGV